MQAFINSKINHLSSISWITLSQAEQLTALVTKKLKAAAGLNHLASPHWLYAPKSIGGLGLYPLHLWLQAKQLTTFLKLLHQTNPLVKAAITNMLDSGMASWKMEAGIPYDTLFFRPNYAVSANQAPLYQELADLKAQTFLFQVKICRRQVGTSFQYGLLFRPWLNLVDLISFPAIEDDGHDPFWFNQPLPPQVISRELGPPQGKSDKQWISFHLLKRIGYMETVALQEHLVKRHKSCPPLIAPSLLLDPSLVYNFLSDRRVTSEWQVQLWAQRTGELFLPGAQAWLAPATFIQATSVKACPCPLCKMATHNLSLHWLLNCSCFSSQYEQCAEQAWQVLLAYVRRVLYQTAPVHRIFSLLREKPPHLASAVGVQVRLRSFWFMNGLGTPTTHFETFLLALRHPFTGVVMDLQKVMAKMNVRILGLGIKRLGAFACTSLEAC